MWGHLKGNYINDKFSVLENCVCVIRCCFHLAVSFLILFCSHLQNKYFLANPKTMMDIFS